MSASFHRRVLLAGASLGSILSCSAFAQNATNPPASSQGAQERAAASPDQDAGQSPDIVVTGTLFRRTNTETPSPVTTLSDENLQKAGITNIADAVRSISADNSGSVPTAFSAGFASGAAGVSLRGLTVNSTLVLIDGVRTVIYPFADDGQRSFVDLNTIPKSTIDRIEVLKDGASSTYGADAIGGVVNIITRRQIKGLEGTAEAGTSQRGDGGEQRLTLTAGYGDLKDQGFNVYLNGEYERDGLVRVSDRGFPYNTTDLTSIGGLNNNAGAAGGFGGRIGTISAVVQPARESAPGNILSGVPLTDAAGNPLPTRTLAPAGCAAGLVSHNDQTGSYCEQNLGPYGTIQPEQTRYGFTGHATVRITDAVNAYLTGTYYRSRVLTLAQPQVIRQVNPINTQQIVLPAILSNGQRNPQDPYAVAGCVEGVSCVDAQITYAFGDIPFSAETRNDLYRIAGGAGGDLGDGWSFSIDATYARSHLVNDFHGFLSISGLTRAIADGTYNFVDPSQNGSAIRNQVSPVVSTTATSSLALLQASITKDLAQLPGGELQLGVGGSVRRETLNNPNANANNAFLNVNAVTASGARTVSAAFFELSAPILRALEINASGRYDHYSDGFSRFSPKVGIKLTPIRALAVRGTYSRGFRAPSLPESQNGSVIGFITAPPLPDAVVAAHGNDAYVQAYSLGLNSAANPNLRPEKSRSFTLGVIVQPSRWLSMTADYYNIRKTDVIAGGPLAGQALGAYYAGQPLPAGYSVVLDGPDPLHPNAVRKILTINSPYANAASLNTSGIDVSIQADLRLGSGARFMSRLEDTEILTFKYDAGDGVVDSYVGTQAPYILSSGAGTPRWRANWMNSLELGPLSLTATGYYVSGYKTVAVDAAGHGATSCADSLYGTGDVFCSTRGFFDLDVVAQLKVSERFTFYVNVINALDARAPLNPDNYAALNYNPTWSQAGIVGRFFRAGANFKF